MAAYNKFNLFVEDLCKAQHAFQNGGNAFKVGLSNTLPLATGHIYGTDITEITAGNGYTAGGATVASQSVANASGTETVTLGNVTFTASGGSIGPFRYAVLQNSSSGPGFLVCWFDYGSSITLNSGDTFTVAWNGGGSTGTLFTLT